MLQGHNETETILCTETTKADEKAFLCVQNFSRLQSDTGGIISAYF